MQILATTPERPLRPAPARYTSSHQFPTPSRLRFPIGVISTTPPRALVRRTIPTSPHRPPGRAHAVQASQARTPPAELENFPRPATFPPPPLSHPQPPRPTKAVKPERPPPNSKTSTPNRPGRPGHSRPNDLPLQSQTSSPVPDFSNPYQSATLPSRRKKFIVTSGSHGCRSAAASLMSIPSPGAVGGTAWPPTIGT